VIRPLASRFDSDLVIHSESKLLLTGEVMFRSLDRHVTEEELNVIEFPVDVANRRRADLMC
jgi:hypothetical protein